jgi:predicted transcriptional regulator
VERVENLCDLLFEVSNEDRLRILRRLQEGVLNVTGLSRALDLTTQESSRHLSRLGDVGLTGRDADGLYSLTPYASLVLRQLGGFEFTSAHKDYFLSHTLESLPGEFLCRISELAESTYVDDVMVAIYNVERAVQRAEEYFWIVTDQYPVSSFPLLTDAYDRGVRVRTIDAANWDPPPQLKEGVRREDAEAVLRARRTGAVDERILGRLDVVLWMSEKEVAGLAFPTLEGRFDYLGFNSADEKAHKWCSDLFNYYWDRGEKKTEFVLITEE